MVNNIAANVLGGKPELEGGAETGGNHPQNTHSFFKCQLSWYFPRHPGLQHAFKHAVLLGTYFLQCSKDNFTYIDTAFAIHPAIC